MSNTVPPGHGFDLGSFDYDLSQPAEPKKIDNSGKPAPTQAFLVTADGYRIVADIVFDGIDDETGDRRYALIVETDWASVLAGRGAAIQLDQLPPDVRVMFKQPGNFSAEDRRTLADLLASIKWVIGSQTAVTHRTGDSPVVKRAN